MVKMLTVKYFTCTPAFTLRNQLQFLKEREPILPKFSFLIISSQTWDAIWPADIKEYFESAKRDPKSFFSLSFFSSRENFVFEFSCFSCFDYTFNWVNVLCDFMDSWFLVRLHTPSISLHIYIPLVYVLISTYLHFYAYIDIHFCICVCKSAHAVYGLSYYA